MHRGGGVGGTKVQDGLKMKLFSNEGEVTFFFFL